MSNEYKRAKTACYTINLSMAAVGNLPPILFLTFRELYGISYSLLGLLVLINFVTQLTVDLIFSFFSHKFDIHKTVRFTPVLAVIGLIVYAAWPSVFPDSVYAGLVIGTVIFSGAAGLVEVLISPVIAAIPAEDPDREMSTLHSIYAWGVVGVVLISTLFLLAFGKANWQYLTLLFALLPLAAAILFTGAKLPPMETPEKMSGALAQMKNKALWLCFVAIFLGGASECTMAQWSSGYLEQAMGLPKVWGDLFGTAMFGLTLGLGRTLYARFGKNISTVLFAGAVGASVCYLAAAVSPIPVIGLVACALTGFCVSMLWPGCLIVAENRIPGGGVFLFAMMAAGGDLGASVGPQLIGLITDAVIALPGAADTAAGLGLAPDQLGMKIGMLVGMLFPLAAIFVYHHIRRTEKK